MLNVTSIFLTLIKIYKLIVPNSSALYIVLTLQISDWAQIYWPNGHKSECTGHRDSSVLL